MSQQSIGIFVAAALPRALGITEVDADIRRDGELAMIGQFCSAILGQRCHDTLRQVLHPGNQGADNAVAVLATDLDQYDKPRAAFDQRGDMAVSGTTQQIAFPMAGNGAVLDLCRAVTNREGIYDLPPRLPRSCCRSAPAHDPAAAQLGQQLPLENATRLNEQAFVDRLV